VLFNGSWRIEEFGDPDVKDSDLNMMSRRPLSSLANLIEDDGKIDRPLWHTRPAVWENGSDGNPIVPTIPMFLHQNEENFYVDAHLEFRQPLLKELLEAATSSIGPG
jgi:hypothetical protein